MDDRKKYESCMAFILKQLIMLSMVNSLDIHPRTLFTFFVTDPIVPSVFFLDQFLFSFFFNNYYYVKVLLLFKLNGFY